MDPDLLCLLLLREFDLLGILQRQSLLRLNGRRCSREDQTGPRQQMLPGFHILQVVPVVQAPHSSALPDLQHVRRQQGPPLCLPQQLRRGGQHEKFFAVLDLHTGCHCLLWIPHAAFSLP